MKDPNRELPEDKARILIMHMGYNETLEFAYYNDYKFFCDDQAGRYGSSLGEIRREIEHRLHRWNSVNERRRDG